MSSGKIMTTKSGKILTTKSGKIATSSKCCCGCSIDCDALPTGLLVNVTRDGIAFEGAVIGGPGCTWAGTVFALDESGQIEVSITKTEGKCGFTISFDPEGGSSVIRNTMVGPYPDATDGFTYTAIEVS